MFGPSDKGIPGVTPDIFKEFLEKAIAYVCMDNRSVVRDVFKSQHDFFGYTFPGLAELECEVTENDDILVHWGPSTRSRMKYIVGLADFDDVMMDKTAPMTAIVLKKLKVDGPMTEAMKFITFMPALKLAYKKARKEIGHKYDLMSFKEG